MDHKNKLKHLTKEQKIKLIMGADFWTNYDVDGSVYKFIVSDGPVGLRQPLDRMTAEQTDCIKSVAYPSFQMLSQTWDTGLAFEMGRSGTSQTAHPALCAMSLKKEKKQKTKKPNNKKPHFAHLFCQLLFWLFSAFQGA